MPKKKVKKGDDKQEEGEKSPAERSGAEQREKDLYLSQIRHLTEQVERYRLRSDELERTNKDVKAQCSLLEKEKKDVVEFLKRSLLEKEDEVDALTERLEEQRQAGEKVREEMQLQQNQLREDLHRRMEELTAENTTLGARLSSLEEFQKQKEELQSNMESLQMQLTKQKDEHKAELHNLDMKALLEKRRLQEELESHKAAMAEEVQHRVHQNLPETTRMVLQENTELKVQLGQISQQAKTLKEDNTALLGHKKQLSLDVDILEKMISEMSRQSVIRKKVVEQLTEKCQQLQKEQKDGRQEVQQLHTQNRGILAQMEALRKEQASMSDQLSKDRAEVHRLEAELEKGRKKSSRMKSIIQEAAATLRQALMEAESTELESDAQWKKLMQKLLLVLNGPTEENQLNSDPAAAHSAYLDPALSFQFQLARYRPGDLGLVPPPALKHKDRLPRTGAGSGSTTTLLHRKPFSQKPPSDSAAGPSVTKLK